MGTVQDEILAVIRKKGNATAPEIAAALGKSGAQIATELARMLPSGSVRRLGEKRPYTWELGGDSPGPVARKAPRKKSDRSSPPSNGASSASGMMSDAVALMRQALVAEKEARDRAFEAKLSALDVLAKG